VRTIFIGGPVEEKRIVRTLEKDTTETIRSAIMAKPMQVFLTRNVQAIVLRCRVVGKGSRHIKKV
jgi:hypothetical protein